MSNNPTNVIPLLFWRGKAPSTNAVRNHVWARVYDIGSSTHFYWDNIDPDLEHARDFIRILLWTSYVTIHTEWTGITRYAKLSVSEWDEEPLELYAQDFIKLLYQNWGKIDDIEESIIKWLTEKDIKVHFKQGDTLDTKEVLTMGMVSNYRVEEIPARKDDITYKVDLHFWNGITIWLADVDDFDKTQDVSLLEMILTAFDDAESPVFNNLSTDGVSIDVVRETEDITSIYLIPPEFVEKVVYGALLRIDSLLYGPMSPKEAREHYFNQHVMPKLSGVKME